MADARGYSAAAGQRSLAAARSSGTRYAPSSDPARTGAGQMPYYEALSPDQQERLSGIRGWMDREAAAKNLARENVSARSQLLSSGYSELYPEVTTFFQNLKNLPQDQQDNVMNTLRQQANASVDKYFDTAEGFVNAVKSAKLKNYDDQLALLKKGEQQSLDKNLGVIGKGTSDSVRGNYFAQSQRGAGDSGQLTDFANRMIEEYDLQSKQEKDASALAVEKAQQSRDSASNLTSLAAEQDVQDISYQRTAARAQRLSQLMGLNASQDLLLQTPTAGQTSLVKNPTPPIGSGSFVRQPYGNRTSEAGIAANARAGYGSTVAPVKAPTTTTRAPFGARTSTAGKAANARAGYFLP